MKIVVTGGIGSGKSTVTNMLHEKFPDFCVLSIDKLVAKMYDDPLIGDQLIERIGTKDKKAVSDIVFRNEKLRVAVETLFANQITAAINQALASNENIIVEFPLLFEKGRYFIPGFDVIIAVTAKENTRIARVRSRDNFSLEKIENIIAAQVTDETRVAESTLTIDNSRDFSDLIVEVAKTADKIKLFIAQSKNKKIGVVSGSFDPITLGHSWIIDRALKIVDFVIVAIAFSPTKKYMFNNAERMKLVQCSLAETLSPEQLERVIVDFVPDDELTVSFAKQMKAKFIFRGIRGVIDLEYENGLNLLQKKIEPEIETIYLMTPREYIEISSTLVKNVIPLREWERIAKPYVSKCVLEKLKEKAENS